MTLDEYQQAALRTLNRALDERDRLLDASAGLAEEAGEVLGLMRKRVFQGRDVDRDALDRGARRRALVPGVTATRSAFSWPKLPRRIGRSWRGGTRRIPRHDDQKQPRWRTVSCTESTRSVVSPIRRCDCAVQSVAGLTVQIRGCFECR